MMHVTPLRRSNVSRINYIKCMTWPKVHRIFAHAHGVYRAGGKSASQYEVRHVFFHRIEKKVEAQIYDHINKKYYECGFKILSVPLKKYGDVVHMHCDCGIVPAKDNSYRNHYCVHLVNLFRFLIDRTTKQSKYEGDPLITVHFDGNNYIVDDVCINKARLPNNWPGVTEMFEPSVTEKDLITFLNNVDVTRLIALKGGLAQSKAEICTKCQKQGIYNPDKGKFEHKCVDYKIHSQCIFAKSSILSKVNATNFFLLAFYMFDNTLTLKSAAEFSGIRSSATYTKYKDSIHSILYETENFWEVVFGDRVQWDGAYIGALEKKGYLARKHVENRNAMYFMVWNQRFTSKGRHSQVTNLVQTESVKNVRETGIIDKIPDGTIIDQDMGPLFSSYAMREKFINRGVKHSANEWSRADRYHERYDNKITSNGVENANIAPKIANKIHRGLGHGNINPLQKEKWLKAMNFKENHTTGSRRDAFIMFLFAMAQVEENRSINVTAAPSLAPDDSKN